MNVRIGSKIYKNIEQLSVNKLEHLKQLAEIEIANYKNAIKNYSSEKMARVGTPFLARLNVELEKVNKVLASVAETD